MLRMFVVALLARVALGQIDCGLIRCPPGTDYCKFVMESSPDLSQVITNVTCIDPHGMVMINQVKIETNHLKSQPFYKEIVNLGDF